MNSIQDIPQVTSLCKINPETLNINRTEQVEHLSSMVQADLSTAQEFYSRNHVTDGMREFINGAMKRLHGNSGQAIFELRQAMGGGKTHNMIALGLLARFPELGKMVANDGITVDSMNQPARIVTINGRDVENFIWGEIAEQLDRAEEFRDHWVNGPKAINESGWIRMIGDEPTLIMLDELPPYFASAHTQPVGQGTLLDLLKYSLGNLFSAAMKCKHCVVVIASLDASYHDEQRIIGGMLAELKKEISRGAKSITPVDLSTGEIYDILRKRLFVQLPEPGNQDVENVTNAYRIAYQEAIRGKALIKSAEQMADEILESYPFHPGYKDILGLFKENEKFRQTRGLIQFTASLIRGIWNEKNESIFLIGAQHLDFSDSETRNQMREIERTLESALAKDVYDKDGSSHAQEIDNIRNDRAASQVATLLFVSSLSDNTDGIRGLSRDTLVEYLIAPGKEPGQFIEGFDALRDKSWYMHNRDGQKWYFSNIANIRKQIEDRMEKVKQNAIDDEMRRRLTDIFRPVNKTAYSELLVLPRIDDIKLTPSKRICMVLSPDAKSPPDVAKEFFENATYKNTFFVVSGDGSKMGNAESVVRRLLAINSVETTITETPRHQKELEIEKENTEIDFNSTVKTLFNRLWYPQSGELKEIRIDLGRHQEKAIIQGEQTIEEILSRGGAFKLVEINPDDIDALTGRAEDQLFRDETRIRWVDLLERAASDTRWIWLPPKGMDEIKTAALSDRRWVEENGYVDRNPPALQPQIRANKIGGNENEGESEIELAISDAGHNPEILVALSPDGFDSADVIPEYTYKTNEVELWFWVRNPNTDEISKPCHWTGSITITHEKRENAGTWEVSLASKPKAELHWNITGINPKDGAVYDGVPFEIDGQERTTLYIHAQKGNISATRNFTFDAIGAEQTIDENMPARVVQDFQFASQSEISSVRRALKETGDILLYGVSITVGEGECNLRVRGSGDVVFDSEKIEKTITQMLEIIEEPDAKIQLRFSRADFPDGFIMSDFASRTGIDIPVGNIEQDI